MIKLDYSEPEKVCIDLPFNFLSWYRIDLINGKINHDIEDDLLEKIREITTKNLLLTILPTFDTMLHKSVKNLEAIKFVHQLANS